MSWAGTMPVPEYSGDGRPPKRATLTADVVDLWNTSFFRARGVEVVVLDDPECVELMGRFIEEKPEVRGFVVL